WAAGISVSGVANNPTPADVINLSFGGRGLSHTLQDAVDDALAAGAIVVAAAGNTSSDAQFDSPAGLRGVITVGAVDQAGHPAPYSNYGTVVSLLAPGGLLTDSADGTSQGVLSTILLPTGYSYVYYAGTSQAAPYVTATIALMKALIPNLQAPEA